MSKARELASLGNAYSDGALSNRNLIINGAMQVAQRQALATGITTGGYHTADRFNLSIASFGAWTVEVSTDAPDGFSNSYKLTCTTADASPAAGDFLFIEQRLEGQNLQQLKKGTASALPVTLSFWVKSNKTGTYIAEFDDADNSRNINLSYTVSSSGVWEYKTITFDGDTAGVLDNDGNFSARVVWWLGAGSDFNSGTLASSWENTVNANRAVGNVNLADTTSNYFAITGVQLEVGDTATPFEHRSYGQELALCQRYYQAAGDGLVGSGVSFTAVCLNVRFSPQMRANPSGIITDNSVKISDHYFSDHTSSGSIFAVYDVNTLGGRVVINGFSALTAGRPYSAFGNSFAAVFGFDAEL